MTGSTCSGQSRIRKPLHRGHESLLSLSGDHFSPGLSFRFSSPSQKQGPTILGVSAFEVPLSSSAKEGHNKDIPTFCVERSFLEPKKPPARRFPLSEGCTEAARCLARTKVGFDQNLPYVATEPVRRPSAWWPLSKQGIRKATDLSVTYLRIASFDICFIESLSSMLKRANCTVAANFAPIPHASHASI